MTYSPRYNKQRTTFKRKRYSTNFSNSSANKNKMNLSLVAPYAPLLTSDHFFTINENMETNISIVEVLDLEYRSSSSRFNMNEIVFVFK